MPTNSSSSRRVGPLRVCIRVSRRRRHTGLSRRWRSWRLLIMRCLVNRNLLLRISSRLSEETLIRLHSLHRGQLYWEKMWKSRNRLQRVIDRSSCQTRSLPLLNLLTKNCCFFQKVMMSSLRSSWSKYSRVLTIRLKREEENYLYCISNWALPWISQGEPNKNYCGTVLALKNSISMSLAVRISWKVHGTVTCRRATETTWN
jgi:hypothetical protein